MPLTPPPDECPDTPLLAMLEAGTILYRVHAAAFAPGAFNHVTGAPPGGGRFDVADAGCGRLYAAATPAAAIAETLVRRIPLAGGPRYLLRAVLEGVVLSPLVSREPLPVVQLHGPGLTRVGQTALLTSCEAVEYGRTREWAAALRQWAPEAAGFEWRARHDNDALAYVFYSDRVGCELELAGPSVALDGGEGLALVRDALLAHGIVLGR